MAPMINNREELERMIERYFDAKTSLEDERALRHALANETWSGGLADEARFAMGFFAMHKQSKTVPRKRRKPVLLPAAASIALLLGVGALVFTLHRPAASECIAYVNGKTVSDKAQVMSLIEKELTELGGEADALSLQLSSLNEAIVND